MAVLAGPLATLVVGVSPAAAQAPADCGWRATAQALADSLTGVTDPDAVALLAALKDAGVTPGGQPAECAPLERQAQPNPTPSPDPTAPPSADPSAEPSESAGQPAVPQSGAEVCDKFGRTAVDNGRYIVQNNQWGPDAPQCVTAFSNGFTVDKATGQSDSMPVAYPSIFYGCHYGCTADSGLPRQTTALGDLRTSWAVKTPDSGDWNAAYDIWFDPTARTDGTVTGTEMMIWLDKRGKPQPLGSKVDTVTLAGTSWDVWVGENGAKVVSYVRSEPADSVQNMPLKPFIDDASARGALDKDWYLTSIQAGFEPWSGGAGLATTSFSVDGVLP